MSSRLRAYCFVSALHGAAQGLLLFAVPITSLVYGFEWYLARIVQLALAVAYSIEIGRQYELRAGWFVATIIGLVFGVTPSPETWYNWLALGYSLALLILGTMIVVARDFTARLVGFYWSATGCWQYSFARLSGDTGSVVWKLNWWLPSLLSILFFLILALKKERTNEAIGDNSSSRSNYARM